ncbi:MAG: type IVB secretion system protein IcmW [Gammaproteobacteria bacterium]
MPDLRTDAVHAFWDSYDRRTLYRIVVALEKVETWATDKSPKVQALLEEFGTAIDRSRNFDLKDESRMVTLLANISAGKALRLLQSLEGLKPGSASQLLMYAEEAEGAPKNDRHAKLFLKRNLVFERLQLLARVFSPQRISLILRALEKLHD